MSLPPDQSKTALDAATRALAKTRDIKAPTLASDVPEVMARGEADHAALISAVP